MSCSARGRLGDAVLEADVTDRPHRAPRPRRVLAVDVRVERHVHVLVLDVQHGRAAGARRAVVPAADRRGAVSTTHWTN